MDISFAEFTRDDFDFFYSCASEPSIKKGLDAIVPTEEFFINKIILSKNNPNKKELTEKILFNETPCGIITTNQVEDEVELFYGVLPLFRNRGIASKAFKMKINWLENIIGIKRFHLRIDPTNHSSLKIAYNNKFEDDYFESGMKLNYEKHFKIELIRPAVVNKNHKNISDGEWDIFESHLNKGLSLSQKEQHEQAIENYKESYKINPNNPLLSYLIGVSYSNIAFKNQNPNIFLVFEGIQYFNEAIFGIQNGSNSKNQMINAYLTRGRLKLLYDNKIGAILDIEEYLAYRSEDVRAQKLLINIKTTLIN